MDYQRAGTASLFGAAAALALAPITGGVSLLAAPLVGASVGFGVDTAMQAEGANAAGQEFTPLPDTVANPFSATTSSVVGLVLVAGSLYIAWKILKK